MQALLHLTLYIVEKSCVLHGNWISINPFTSATLHVISWCIYNTYTSLYLEESFTVLAECTADRVLEPNGCFSPLHKICIRAIDSVTWKTLTTRKRRQSYRHADPRQQQQHMAVAAYITSNHATMTVFLTVWPLTFWALGQCMLSDHYGVYVCQVWCW